jgi:hypothetical protein
VISAPLPLLLPLSGELPMSSDGASSPAMDASHGEPHTNSFFFVGWPKRMHMTSLLLSPPSILFETNSNLRILRDSVFQLNLDFISNANLNPPGLLPHPYIILGVSPPCHPPQNRALAATRVPPPSPLPIVAATSIPKPSLQIKPLAGHEKPRT